MQTHAEKREYLGNIIYEFIEEKHPNEAPKIAGMILD